MLKRFFIATILFLIGSQACAGSFDLLPTLDSIRVAETIFPNNPDAANKVQKAFVMQSGIETSYNSFRKATNDKFSLYGDEAKSDTERFIDEETPANPKTVAITAAVAYTIAVSKSYTQNLGEPIFPGLRQTITIGQDKIMTGIIYSF